MQEGCRVGAGGVQGGAAGAQGGCRSGWGARQSDDSEDRDGIEHVARDDAEVEGYDGEEINPVGAPLHEAPLARARYLHVCRV